MHGIGTIDWLYRWNAPTLTFTHRDGLRSSSLWIGRVAGVDRHGRAPERAGRRLHLSACQPRSLRHARVGATGRRTSPPPAGGQELDRARVRPYQGSAADRLGGLLTLL